MCLFMCTRLLPCRHVFYLRKALGQETVIPTLLLNKRWLVSTVRAAIENERSTTNAPVPKSFDVKSVLPSQARPWDSNRKYREALPIASEICDTMSGLGMVQYKEVMKYLHKVANRIKKGEFEDPGPLSLTRTDAGSMEFAQVDTQVDTLPNSKSVPPTQVAQTSEIPIDILPQDDADYGGLPAGVTSYEDTSCHTVEPIRVEDQLAQSGPVGSESGQVRNLSESRILVSAAEDTAFFIASPPRSRGRPKKTAKAKKAARNKAVSVAQQDSELYASNLSLASVEAALTTESTYASSAEVLNKFKMVEYGFKFKSPTARMVSSPPPTKHTLLPESITRILRPEQIATCMKKVVSLQSKHKGLPESAVALDIPSFGVYSTGTIRIMKKWHTSMKVIKLVEKALKWIGTIDFSTPMPAQFHASQQIELPSLVKSIPLLSAKAEILDLVAKTQLSDDTINSVMARLFGTRNDVIMVNPNVIGSVRNGEISINMNIFTDVFADVFAGVTTEKILIPVCCNKSHWCGIMMNTGLTDVCIFDPMGSSYTVAVRALAEKLVTQLPDYVPRKYRVYNYQSELGVQVDSYNCGMYVLLAFELFAGAQDLCMLSRKELQYLRTDT